MKPATPASPKKPYRSPQLRVYGTLAEMTLTKSTGATGDGGIVVGMRRTG